MKEADDSIFFLHLRVSVKCDLLLSRFEVSLTAQRGEGMKVWRRQNENSLRQSRASVEFKILGGCKKKKKKHLG